MKIAEHKGYFRDGQPRGVVLVPGFVLVGELKSPAQYCREAGLVEVRGSYHASDLDGIWYEGVLNSCFVDEEL